MQDVGAITYSLQMSFFGVEPTVNKLNKSNNRKVKKEHFINLLGNLDNNIFQQFPQLNLSS